jgi:hypothetical protein
MIVGISFMRGGEIMEEARHLLMIAKEIIGEITLTEEGGKLVVRGPYDEMKDIYPKLKGRGFRYNSPDRSWRIDKSKMTPSKMKNIQKLLPDPVDPSERERAESQNKQNYSSVISRLDLFPALKVDLLPNGFSVSGDTYPIRNDMRRLGGKWNGSDKSYEFGYSMKQSDFDKVVSFLEDVARDGKAMHRRLMSILKPFKGDVIHFDIKEGKKGFWIVGQTKPLYDIMKRAKGSWDSGRNGMYFYYTADPDDIRSIYDEAEDVDRGLAQEIAAGISLAKKLDGQTWDFGNVKAMIRGNSLWISTSDKKYRDAVKGSFSSARWGSGLWMVPFSDLNSSNVKSFLGEMEDFERESMKEYGVSQRGDTIRFSYGSGYYPHLSVSKGEVIPNHWKRTNKGPDYLYILDVKRRYVREDGMSFGVGDDSGYIYTIIAREPTPAEAAPLMQKELFKKSKQDAIRELEEIEKDIRKRGRRPSGSNSPNGKIVYLSKTALLYGGGSWFVVSPSEVWFVQNNGSDGDDWSLNNVLTGGAGGIGWVVPNRDGLGDRVIELARL